jgi:hypothetical protein
MTAAKTDMVLLDPTVEALPDNTNMAQRLPDLNGRVLGLLANGKRNSDTLLDAVTSLLQDTYEVKEVVRLNKRDVSRPVKQEMVDELLERCDAVITAIGD